VKSIVARDEERLEIARAAFEEAGIEVYLPAAPLRGHVRQVLYAAPDCDAAHSIEDLTVAAREHHLLRDVKLACDSFVGRSGGFLRLHQCPLSNHHRL